MLHANYYLVLYFLLSKKKLPDADLIYPPLSLYLLDSV